MDLDLWERELEEWRSERNEANTFGRDASDTIYYSKMKALIKRVRELENTVERINEKYTVERIAKLEAALDAIHAEPYIAEDKNDKSTLVERIYRIASEALQSASDVDEVVKESN